MYEAGQNSFQMFHLDGAQKGLFMDGRFWPALDGRSKFAVRWQDHAVLVDIDRFFYLHNYGYWFSYDKDERYAYPDGKVVYAHPMPVGFPFSRPYYAQATKVESYPGSSDFTSHDLVPGWFGADLLDFIETGIERRLSERPGDWRSWDRLLPPQLGGSYPYGSSFFVNGLLCTLLSSLRWKYVSRVGSLDGLSDALANHLDCVIVRKGAAKLASSPVVYNSCVERHEWSDSYSWVDDEFSYDVRDDDPRFDYYPPGGFERGDDDPVRTKRLFQTLLGCSFSDLALRLNGLKIFKKGYNDEFLGQGLRAPMVEAAYEMVDALCDADALYSGGWSTTESKYSRSDAVMADGGPVDLPPSHPKRYYSGGYESSAGLSVGTGVHGHEDDYGPRNYRFSVDNVQGPGAGDSDSGSTYIFEGSRARFSVSTSWSSYGFAHDEPDYSGTRKEVRKTNRLWYSGSRTRQTSDQAMATPDFNDHLYFGFGMAMAYTKEGGGSTVSSCKILVPVSLFVEEYRYRYGYREDGSQTSVGYRSEGYSSIEHERTVTQGTVIVPLSLSPFASKRHRDEGSSQLWESVETVSEVVKQAAAKLGVGWAVSDLRQRPKTDVEKPPRAWDPPSPGGGTMTVGESGYELRVTVAVGESRTITDTRDPGNPVYYNHGCGGFVTGGTAVVSWTPEFRSKVTGG